MSTTKRQRKYPRLSQDFSGDSKTDASFAPSCDVNAIVRHYERTGVDPYIDRKSAARYGEASTLTYADAMRMKAELDSYLAEHPEAYSEAAQAAEAADPSPTPSEEENVRSGASSAAEPAPQGASETQTEAKVQ